jgi:peptidylprolyl isomerase
MLAVSALPYSDAATPAPPPKPSRALAEILQASTPDQWRQPDPANTLYMDLASGRVVIELAPQFAPLHAVNIRALVREGYFDGLTIMRVQDNYVTQWGDADGTRAIKAAARTLAPEFTRPTADDLKFTLVPDGDVYAPEVGFVNGFPAARDLKTRTAWLVHCYGMVGAGRDNDVDTGNGAELYAVNGSPTRHIDRNAALVGRVLQGMDLLSSLPRGTGALGMYEKPEQRVPIVRMRLAADLPASERIQLEVLKTDSSTFRVVIEQRRNRHDEWYKVPQGHVDVCNIPIPVRPAP